MEIQSVVCESERRFLQLRGDGTEVVRVASETRNYSGDYLYLRMGDGTNKFLRQGNANRETVGLIERIFCEITYLTFDPSLGVRADGFEQQYKPVGQLYDKREFEREKNLLERAGLWKEVAN